MTWRTAVATTVRVLQQLRRDVRTPGTLEAEHRQIDARRKRVGPLAGHQRLAHVAGVDAGRDQQNLHDRTTPPGAAGPPVLSAQRAGRSRRLRRQYWSCSARPPYLRAGVIPAHDVLVDERRNARCQSDASSAPSSPAAAW